jgi:hypothetical protein
MNEYILSTFALDKSKTLFTVKPLYFATFHFCLLACNPYMKLKFCLTRLLLTANEKTIHAAWQPDFWNKLKVFRR